MTKRDFEFIASILADGETLIAENENITATELRNFLRAKFENQLAATHPRFNRGRFEVAASPIAAKELKDRILGSLAESN
jgi:hypothetical protein